MTLQEFGGALSAAMVPDVSVFHNTAGSARPTPYIVWQETGEKALYGNGAVCERIQQIQVDFYTGTEFDPLLGRILAALAAMGATYDEPIPAYDAETHTDRYIIDCEVL